MSLLESPLAAPTRSSRDTFVQQATEHSSELLNGIFRNCANTQCNSGWLHFLRSRTVPIFEGGWSCTSACTGARLQAAIRREMDGRGSGLTLHRHRIPLGLVMLEQGWITSAQLRKALKTQKVAGAGRLGSWLVKEMGVSEQLVTRALGLQWSCPVLPLELHDGEAMAVLMPRLFVDAFAVLPLRVAAGKLIYLGFEDRIDPILALAISRMTGLRVECGLVQSSLFASAHSQMLSARFPKTELVEAVSQPAAVSVLTRLVERNKPVESQLVRVHDCLWLRMWLRPQKGPLPDVAGIMDVICSIGGH